MDKICNRCNKSFVLEHFFKNPKNKDGHLNQCRNCVYLFRKPRLEVRKKEILEYHRKHRADNRERYNFLSRESTRKNPTSRRIAKRKWNQKNKLYKSIINRNWNAKRLGASGSFSKEQYSKLLDLFKGKCGYCLTREPTTIDHIKPISKGGTNYIDNIMPACLKCNGQKRDYLLEEWFLLPNCYNKNKHLLTAKSLDRV